ncbi:MAG: 2,3-diphosphoglycerate-dependent phosphoglycerate mutase [Candidatus Heimdallarchaeota archaeon]|nr:2,3-diphosphoglycerate-dependent phosphoglycerate mutase [Candidatus Heimdallarchaeota archaeon]
MVSLLCIIRHGESVWNNLNLFTGWTDVSLTERGRKDSIQAAKQIKDLSFEAAFTSDLKRANESLQLILNYLQIKIPVIRSDRLNERHYGALQGLNKAELKQKYGEEQVRIWRRSFDIKPPGEEGESLKDCMNRTVPYLKKYIYPYLRQGKNVLMVGHGNSLRSLIMFIEGFSPTQIMDFDLELTTPYLYYFNSDLLLIKKEIRPIQGAHHSL